MKVVLYGLPCSGKTTILQNVENFTYINGSSELKRMSNNKFHTLSPVEQDNIRKQYIEYLKKTEIENIISDGHYSFWNDVVFTKEDGDIYDAFIYLYVSPKTILERIKLSEKNKRFASLNEEAIRIWQEFEINSLRKECHIRNKDFYVINTTVNQKFNISEFLALLINGHSTYKQANESAKRIMIKYSNSKVIYLVDGDKTIIKEDSFRVSYKNNKTNIFDGDFYTDVQAMEFTRFTKENEFKDELLEQTSLSPLFDEIKNKNYVVLSSGVSELWEKLKEKYNFEMVIASTMISADTKYYVAKILKENGYTIYAYGDSKNDLYMLNEADFGCLVINEKMSGSLKNEDISKLKVIDYTLNYFILSEQNIFGIDEFNKVCKSNSLINGAGLAKAHMQLGSEIAKEVKKYFNNKNTEIVVLDRGGRFFGDGFYIEYGGIYKPYNPKLEPCPKLEQKNVIIIDSVINTGESLISLISEIKDKYKVENIIIVTNVIQKDCIDKFSNYKLFAVRSSENKFKGEKVFSQSKNKGPDTADRLFNLISSPFER